MLSVKCCCQFSCLCRNRFYLHYSSVWSQQLLSSMLWKCHQIIRVFEESECHSSLSFLHIIALSSSCFWTCERCTVVFEASFAETLKFTFQTVWCSLECLRSVCFTCKILNRRWHWQRRDWCWLQFIWSWLLDQVIQYSVFWCDDCAEQMTFICWASLLSL